MKFIIITPSFNQLQYLKRCVASVADQGLPQADVNCGKWNVGSKQPLNSNLHPPAPVLQVHHHIQDGGSTDGTVQWLERYANEVRETGFRQEALGVRERTQGTILSAYSFNFSSEKDEGMYDALNKGFSRATGDVVAWLNCDEQYLPDTLNKAAQFFSRNPSIDILFGGMLMINADGELLACRKAMPMRRLFLEASYLYNFSCAMFIRRDFWNRLGGFNPDYKNAGDEEWVRRAMSSGAKTSILRDYLSVFSYTEDNLSSAAGACREHDALKRAGRAAVRALKLPINLLRLTEKAARGGWVEHQSVACKIYVESLENRRLFEVSRPSCRWPGKRTPYLTSHRLK